MRSGKRLSLACSVLTWPCLGMYAHRTQAPSVSSNRGLDLIGLRPCSHDLICFSKVPNPNTITWRVGDAAHKCGGGGHNLVHGNLFKLI